MDPISTVSEQADAVRETFFKVAFGREEGYVCLAYLTREKDRRLKEHFFHWPEELPKMITDIKANHLHSDAYFCPQLFENPGRRKKDNVKNCPNLWADLDTCDPDLMLLKPTITVESSPHRWQALWVLDEPIAPLDAEIISKRIAYNHAPDGADRSGWDLTQLLRIPQTLNFKYDDQPVVVVTSVTGAKYRQKEFDAYPAVAAEELLSLPEPMPENLPTLEPLELMQKYRHSLNPLSFQLFSVEPEQSKEGWSGVLWQLQMLLFESGMSREEVFHIARDAACNKYRRDGRPESVLWSDVCRAFIRHQENINAVVIPGTRQVDLLSDTEFDLIKGKKSFVERFIEWAEGLGDAAPQYHQAGAFILLSAILAGRVRIPTSFGNILPNLWFMILADTTLTRKSTAMDIAMDLLIEVDSDAVLATDGSLEGLMQGLSGRPGRPSIFLRDEFSGLLEQMTKKDYYAGMAEALTKLYDGKFQKRILRKETIEVKDPVLILFAGGIRTKIQSLLSFEHVSSGFIPRFLFITAESDVARMQGLGPPVARDLSGREALIDELRDLINHYAQTDTIIKPGTNIKVIVQKQFQASLTTEAWTRYNEFEMAMAHSGMESSAPELMTPTYARMAISTLKAACLIAATRMEEEVVITKEDVLRAISYCIQWRLYANDVINGVGKTAVERDLDRIHKAIVAKPGISRSKLMQSYHLTSRSADMLFATLEQRGQITPTKMGKGTVYYAVGYAGPRGD